MLSYHVYDSNTLDNFCILSRPLIDENPMTNGMTVLGSLDHNLSSKFRKLALDMRYYEYSVIRSFSVIGM